MDIPETRYAKTADGVHIAYQAFGDGPVDILFVLGWVTHLELSGPSRGSHASSPGSPRSHG